MILKDYLPGVFVKILENNNKLFGFNVYGKNDKPTNGEFVALVADKLIIEDGRDTVLAHAAAE